MNERAHDGKQKYVCQRTNDSAFNVGDGFARIALDQLLANDLAGLEQ